MIDELNKSIEKYQAKWSALIDSRKDEAFFQALKPTAVAWKMTDMDEFDRCYAEFRDLCDQIHFGWVNERWLATLRLKDTAVSSWNIEIIKLFQRRPGSTDAVGLDHVDFLVPENSDATAVLQKESDLKWTEEANGAHCKWLSLWFDDTEAKLRTDTVLQVCADEMLAYQTKLIEKL